MTMSSELVTTACLRTWRINSSGRSSNGNDFGATWSVTEVGVDADWASGVVEDEDIVVRARVVVVIVVTVRRKICLVVISTMI